MGLLMRFLLMSVLFVMIFSCAKTSIYSIENSNLPNLTDVKSSVIYGIDNRLDYYEISDPKLKQLARSTAAFIDNDHLVYDQIFDQYYLEKPDFKLGMCPNEKFTQQPEWAFCSGSLIADDIVLTAGHCVPDAKSCKQFKVVFDYHLQNPTDSISSLKGKNIFSCRDVIYTTEKKNAADFALIRLDRPVEGRAFLSFSVSELTFKDVLLIVGYPMGKPVKFTTDGKVRSLLSDQFFVASLDAFSGNSGSPVFNQLTYQIVGVLARGEQDFERKNSCYVAKVCSEDSCRGEDVTRISEVMKIWHPKID
jgi:V8-like Glu-specific endopeptidase